VDHKIGIKTMLMVAKVMNLGRRALGRALHGWLTYNCDRETRVLAAGLFVREVEIEEHEHAGFRNPIPRSA